jgi:hypothetical protein
MRTMAANPRNSPRLTWRVAAMASRVSISHGTQPASRLAPLRTLQAGQLGGGLNGQAKLLPAAAGGPGQGKIPPWTDRPSWGSADVNGGGLSLY